MFREMRRNKQSLPKEECIEILKKGTSGVLALSGDDGYPYAVPISYVLVGSRLCFHSARNGHKIEAIRKNEKASFCVIAQDQIVPEKYTTCYKSVIAFGRIRILENETDARKAAEALAVKYYPEDTEENRQETISREWNALYMIELSIEHLSGKQCIELVRA